MAVRKRKKGGEQNPKFNMARGFSTTTQSPPFSFENVVLNFFPLEADYESLETFIDKTVNIAPDFAYFKPIAPMVMMISAYYPKMGLEHGNLGWTAQNEILFTIPVEWYEPVGDEYEFKAIAQYAPFIYVSDESSQAEGREVFGWPKVHGWLAPTINNWVHNPRNPRELLNMKTYVFEHLFRDDIYQPQTLLQIFQQPPSSYSIFPPSADNPLNPFKRIPEVADNLSATVRRLWDWGFNENIRNPLGFSKSMGNLLQGVLNSANSLSGNTINLKQLRDAQNPELACYQAITNARMEVEEVRRAGLLGDGLQLTGDLSGGYTLGISRYPSAPIIESLGLVTHDQDIGSNDTAISYLKPVMPFWQELDMTYAGGENIAWRAAERQGSKWRNHKYVEKMNVESAKQALNDQQISTREGAVPSERDPYLPYYVTEGSAGFQVAEGPFNFPNASFRVLPLLADIDKLNEYLEGSNTHEEESDAALFGQVPNSHIYFEAAEPKVYLTIANYGEMTAKNDNMGLWEETQIKFLIPVRVHRNDESGKRQFVGMGVVAAFDYSNSALGTTTGRELNGWPTVLSEIESLPNTWAGNEGPFAASAPLVQLKTSMPSALFEDQPYAWNTLLEIVQGNQIPWSDSRSWQRMAEHMGKPLKEDLTRMAATTRHDPEGFDAFQSIAMQVMCGEREVHEYSFKQFRDADAPEDACYQAVICNRATMRVKDLRPLGGQTSIRIYDYPTQRIVQTLGLAHFGDDPNDSRKTFRLIACRPFFFNTHLSTRLGDVVCWRAGNRRWRSQAPLAQPPTPVPGRDFVHFINTGQSRYPREKLNNAPQQIDLKMRAWLDEAPDDECLSDEACQQVLCGRFEPHMVLHAALSNEWEHWGLPRWFIEQERRDQLAELASEDDFQAEADVGLRNRFGLGERGLEINRPSTKNVPAGEIRQLPTFVIPTDCVGPEEDRIFPPHERVPDELDPQYWTPPDPQPEHD